MGQAILRADGSSHLGMGHIMRSVAFAAGLSDVGVRPIFITKTLDSRVANVIRSNGFDVEEVPRGTTGDEDARLSTETAAKVGARCIVTDLWHRSALADPEGTYTYHRGLGPELFVVGIASGEMTDMPADVIVSPYVTGAGAGVALNGGRTLLHGPSYFIFRPEFIAAARMARTISKEATRVLVMVGGSDEPHLTAKIAKSLCALSDLGLSLRVVMGAAYSDRLRREVSDVLSGFCGEYRLLEHDANMAEAMLWADLAITGDGLVKYETAVTGTPSIMLSRPGSEKSLNREFERAGTTLHPGDGSLMPVDVLAGKIRQVIGDHSLRLSMSEQGRALVDGRGLERIIAHIPEGVLR